MKKGLKIIGFVFLTFLLLVLVAIMVFNQPLPEGHSPEKADSLALEMMNSLNQQAYDTMNFISWSFYRDRTFYWQKDINQVTATWGETEVIFSPETMAGKASVGGILQDAEQTKKLIRTAWTYYANDSFWLLAAFKVFDPGTSRMLVDLPEGKGLLVTYSSGGVTPGDSYLWILGEDNRPKAWQMWVKILPIGGLKFTWEGWENHKGIYLSTIHTGPAGRVVSAKVHEVR